MTKVMTEASMSLDGYVSGPDFSGFDLLFQWYERGDVVVETADPELTFRLTEVSSTYWHRLIAETGALVVGRTLFDHVEGWGGRHPMDVPVVLLSHSVPDGWPRADAPFHVVTEGGIERAVAVARDLAGDKNVVLNSGTIATQALEAGLLDEVCVDLVPVILGAGTPFFTTPANAPYTLDGPLSVAEGDRVTHLRYRVRYGER
ncbi:dihydrofolate reductase family protein [Streptomyces sp. NPDC047097]|uniref:dihydrofolate reductase family protein n=1 Tax=Streptomyces sp. NPDC047097 TaxID=3155260 RepID=UPI0033F8DC70